MSEFLIISMENVIKIIGAACLFNSLVLFKYWDCFIKFFESRMGCDIKSWRFIIYNNLASLIGCPNCLTFWTLLISTLNPYFAGIGFIISKIIENYIHGYNK